MMPSKLSRYMSAFLFLLLAACELPSPTQNPASESQSTATFNVKSVEGSFTATILHEKFAIPAAKRASFSVCVEDTRTRKAVQSHKFEIKSESTTTTATTDTNGCLNWSEKVDYDHTAKALNIRSERQIKAVGIHQGAITVPFMLNPWENEVVSLFANPKRVPVDETNSATAFIGQTESQTNQKASLWIEDMRLTIDQPGYVSEGAVITIKIRANMQINRARRDGTRVLEPLTKGDFETELTLMNTRVEEVNGVRSERNIPLTKSIKAKANFDQSFLYMEAETSAINLCKFGPLRLGVVAKPTTNIGQLSTFEGVFTIGSCDNLIGNVFSRNINKPSETGFRLAEFLNAPLPAANDASFSKATIELRKIQFSGVAKFQVQGIHRKRTFNVYMCAQSGIDNKPIRFQTFDVIGLNQKLIHPKTDNDGCMSWDDSVLFNYYEPEHESLHKIIVKNPSLGFTREVDVMVNPWNLYDNFARHMEKLEVQSHELMTAKGQTHINLLSYDLSKLNDGFSYRLDPYLNLIFQKRGNLSITARVSRPCLTDPRGYCDNEDLPMGLYLLRYALSPVMITKNDKFETTPIHDAGYKILRNKGSNILEGFFELETTHIKDNGNTQNLFLEVIPLKDGAEEILKANPATPIESLMDSSVFATAKTFRSTIYLSLPNNSDKTPEHDTNIDSNSTFVQKLTTARALQVKSRLATFGRAAQLPVFARDNNLSFLELKNKTEVDNFVKSVNLAQKQYISLQGGMYWGRRKGITAKDLTDLMYKNSISTDMAKIFCDYMIYAYLPKLQYDGKPVFRFPRGYDIKRLGDACRANVTMKTPHGGVLIKKRLLLSNPKLLSEFLKGTWKDFNITTSHGFSFAEAVTKSISFDGSLGVKFLDLAGIVSGSVGPKIGIAKSWSDSQANQTGFADSISGLEERIDGRIVAPQARYCMTVQLGHMAFTHFKMFREHANYKMSSADLTKSLTAGIIICDEYTNTSNLVFDESYHVLSQKPVYALGSDTLSERFRQFYAFIRGTEDFNIFKNFLLTSIEKYDSAKAEAQVKQITMEKVKELYDSTLGVSAGHLVRTYQMHEE